MLRTLKTALLAVLALALPTLTGCIVVIEQAPAEKATPAKKAATKPAATSAEK